MLFTFFFYAICGGMKPLLYLSAFALSVFVGIACDPAKMAPDSLPEQSIATPQADPTPLKDGFEDPNGMYCCGAVNGNCISWCKKKQQ